MELVNKPIDIIEGIFVLLFDLMAVVFGNLILRYGLEVLTASPKAQVGCVRQINRFDSGRAFYRMELVQ